MSTRAPALGAALLLLGAGEAAAQTQVCTNTPAANQTIDCRESSGSTNDIRIDTQNPVITTTPTLFSTIYAEHNGTGGIDVDVTGGSLTTTGTESWGVHAVHYGGVSGDIDVSLENVAIESNGNDAGAVRVSRTTGADGAIAIAVTGGSLSATGSSSHGIYSFNRASGNIDFDTKDVTITTGGSNAHGIYGVLSEGSSGDIDIDVRGGSIKTRGSAANAIRAHIWAAPAGDIDIDVTDGAIIETAGTGGAHAIFARHEGTGDSAIRMSGGAVTTKETNAHGLRARHSGMGDAAIVVTGGAVTTTKAGARGIFANRTGGSGKISIAMSGGSVATAGAGATAIDGRNTGTGALAVSISGDAAVATAGAGATAIAATHTGTGALSFSMSGGSVGTRGALSRGIVVSRSGTGTGGVDVDVQGGSVTTEGNSAHALLGWQLGSSDIDIDVTGGSLTTTGERAYAVMGWRSGASGDTDISLKDVVARTSDADSHAVIGYRQGGTGAIRLDVEGGSVTTEGSGAGSHAVVAWQQGSGDIDIDVKDAAIETQGRNSAGVFGYRSGSSGNIDVDVQGGSVASKGLGLYGVHAWARDSSGTGDIEMSVAGTVVTMERRLARAVFAENAGTGDLAVKVSDGAVARADGERSIGVYAVHGGNGAITLDVSGETVVAVEGGDSAGVYAYHFAPRAIANEDTTVDMTIGAGAQISAPFATGVQGRLSGSNTAGVAISHAGAIRARDTGILAWAALSSGIEILRLADHEGVREPMIHVTSSGDVTVGAGVMDAWVREVVAGDDGTLSAGEQAVLGAIEAEDPDALDTALAALPAGHTDAWKARVRGFLSARGLSMTDQSQMVTITAEEREADRATFEILGIPRAGIRAMAMDHERISGYIRISDQDPAILAIDAASRTPEQQAALQEQRALSTAERRVLEASLLGGDLEAALATLPADYTDAEKTGIRLRATYYNEGDIRVDLTGGTIVSDGDGVHARYILTNDRNGAITVTVAGGASVSGERNGIYVGSAGLAEGGGGLRAQTVTVNGAAMGGTGAGVHMASGGRLTVGAEGRVGATSGDGVLGDGGGDLIATISGTVAGDIRVRGAGALTANIMAGGAVTGTIHEPQTPFTVANGASIGRLLYANGATVTVAGGGRVTGVDGKGVESAAGPLTVTVNDEGRVESDIVSGGTLTANVRAGGVVTGTIREPQTPFTVANGASIGRLLYANGATVTVVGGGRVTGVDGKGVESAAGPLTVTVNDEGRVESDIVSGGTLTANVRAGGVVTGTIREPQTPFTVSGSIGRLLYGGSASVTVAGGGRVTGVDGKGVESAAGPLTVTVNDEGRVEGDILAGGTLSANVNAGGVVTGTIHAPQTPFTVGNRVSIGRLLYANGATVTVSGGGTLTGVEGTAVESTAGLLTVTVNDEGRVEGDIVSGGTLMATVNAGGMVTGTIRDPQTPFTVGNGASIGRLLYTNGSTVTVAATGKLTGVEVEDRTEALRSEAGDLALTVAGMGTVTGDVRALGDGDLTATVAGTLTGDIIEEGEGNLSATVSGTVDGDLRAEGGGALTLNLRQGGTVTGTVHDPVGPLTVAGRIGRLLYTSGATVTVAATGALTGVEVEGRTEALRSEAGDLALTVAGMGTVTGDVRALGDGDLTATVAGTLTGDVIEEGEGNLSATVSGTVDGDLRAEGGGALTLNLRQGGTVTGTVHDPVGPLTVAGRIGRLLYTSGATVTVAATGALTGVEVEGKTEALRSEAGDLDVSVAGRVTGDVRALGAGDLEATISGTLTGDVFGLGAGEHTVTVANGGTVTGTVHLAASTVSVDGRAGRVRFDNGGTVTVGTTGWITGIEVGGRTEAIRNAAGELVVSVAGGGRITGDIIDLGARPARVTTEPGSRVAGSIDVVGEGSAVRVGGTVAGRVRFRRGGMVTVGQDGRIEGRVSSDRGELVAVVERKPEETEAEAVERAFPGGVVEEGGTPTIRSVGSGLGFDPGARVYEALPSVVLGLNGLPGFRERMAAPRSAKGGWARVEAFRGKWKAEASTSGKESGVGLEHRHRRHGIQVGLAGALGEEALLGVSLHHRRGSAEVSEGGDLELSGTGVGVSGTWVREEVYVDVQAEMTGYEADLTSTLRTVLKKDVSGLGHALGVEAGRRLALERLPAGVVLTPRAGLVHSRVSVDAFSDAVGSRVTVDGARSLKGRVGVEAEAKVGGAAGSRVFGSVESRVFGSVEVEHEFSTGRKVRVSGRELKSEAEATWLRLGLDGAHTWEDRRYTLQLQGGVGYATSGGSNEFGGGLSLRVRF